MSKSSDAFVRIRKTTKKKLDQFAKTQCTSFIEAARVAADALESLPLEKQRDLLTDPGRQVEASQASQ